MSSTILIPLDGSALAERALPYAIALARRANGHLLLLRAEPGPLEPGVRGTEGYLALVERAEVETALVAEKLRAIGLRVEQAVVCDQPQLAILEAARLREVDVIVMSTHGRSGLGRWLYGSVADQVLRSADRPVLLIPAACDRTWPAEPASTSGPVIVPLDGSDLAEEAIAPAVLLAQQLGTRLLLVRVVEPITYPFAEGYVYVPIDATADLDTARRYLEAIASDLRIAGRTVDVLVDEGQAASTIARMAREENAEAIAMATHGRSGLARLVMGSVATAVLQRSNAPLLLIRPGAVHEPAAQPVLGVPARKS